MLRPGNGRRTPRIKAGESAGAGMRMRLAGCAEMRGMHLRRATPEDAGLLAEHRAAVWHEVGDWDLARLKLQTPIWADFFAVQLALGTYVAFIVEENGRAVGSGAILEQLMIPRPGFGSERGGRIQSVYVVPSARRRGIARDIVDHLVRYAKVAKLLSLTLHPSDEARTLYEAFGFEWADEMILRLS